MNKLLIGREIAKFIGGAGVSTVVKNAIQHTTPNDISKMQKTSVWIGTFIASAIAGDMAQGYIDRMFDEVMVFINKEKDESTDEDA